MMAGTAAGALAGCGANGNESGGTGEESLPLQFALTPQPDTAGSSATPEATPQPFPAGREERALLGGSPWESPVSIVHSGAAGPTVLVLGGVHGNEPGGWLAAEELATLEPTAGSLLVMPRANQLAIVDFVRTHPELGDLNRLYPGHGESDLPMERMAAEIVALAKEFRVDVALDLHESWGFYSTREQNGTAFLGQTVTAGVGPRNPGFVTGLVERANSRIMVERDLMVFREGSAFRRPESESADATTTRGRSSLSLGGHVPGLTPVLVEMGQEGQPVERRVELHLIVVTEALAALGMA